MLPSPGTCAMSQTPSPGNPRMQSFSEIIAGHAARNPDGAAFFEPGRTLTWAGYHHLSDALAAHFIDAGLKKGERVGIYLQDGALMHAALIGAEKAGLVSMGLGARAGLREVRHLMQVAEATALVTHASLRDADMNGFFAEVKEVVPSLRQHLVLNEDFESQFPASVPLSAQHAAAIAERRLRPTDIAILNSTSGTTGMPKCVVHDEARWQVYHRYSTDAGQLTEQDIFLSAVPMPFGFSIWTSHVTPMMLGAPCAIMPKFSPELMIELIDRHKVTVMAAVTTQFIMMLNSPAMAKADLSSLRILFTGGEMIPYDRAAEFEDRTGATVLNMYGSNETGVLSYTRVTDSRQRRLTGAGKVIPDLNVRLFEGRKDVTASGRGQPGGKGAVLSRGYYNNPEANAKLFTDDGWMLMEDIVTIDGEGYLTVVGRVGDFIIRGGKNISAAAVEEAVGSHPAVALAAAVAAPDKVFGERVMLFVETRDGKTLTLPEVKAHLESVQASKEIYPEYLVVMPEIPRAPGGKVAKGALREEARKRVEQLQAG